MHSTAIPAAASLLDQELSTVGPVLVASDGTESSEPALMAALQLSQQTGGSVYVVAIHESLPPVGFELAALPAVVEADKGNREALRQQVAAQVHRIADGQYPAWTVIVRDGDPAEELPRIATELAARVLVIGVRHRQLADRLFGRETALRLLQRCRVPLLVVPAGFAHHPHRALVATDFGPASLEAARTALRLFDSITDISLLHVTPSPVPPPQLYASWREWVDEDTTRGFAWVKSELQLSPSIKVETVTREGHAAQEIVAVARDKATDLIVTASRGAGMVNRLLMGSTARGVVHAADCAVLVVRPKDEAMVEDPSGKAFSILEPVHQR